MSYAEPQKPKELHNMHGRVWFWKDLFPLVKQFCREKGVSFNRVVNLAVQDFLGVCDVEELKLRVRLGQLLREEAELRRVSNAMLRSGSYLPGYVERVLREPGRSVSLARSGQVPLKALSSREERVFRKIAARREKIAYEIAIIQERLLVGVKPFRLKPSWSRRRDKSKHEGGEKQDG